MSNKNCNTELSLSKGTSTIKNLNITLGKDLSNNLYKDTKLLLNYYTKKEIDTIINSLPKCDEKIEVIDSLDSTNIQKALSANQGRILDLKKADRSELKTDKEITDLVDLEINTRVPIISVNNKTLIISDKKIFNI